MKAIDEGGSRRGHRLWEVCVDGTGLKIGALRAEMEKSMKGKCEWRNDVIFTNSHTETKAIWIQSKILKKQRHEIQSQDKIYE